MNIGSRGFRGRGTNNGARSAEQADVGNRRTFDEIKIPPDNIGNNADNEYFADTIFDSLGNSLDEEPCHLKSGILTSLVNAPQINAKPRKLPNHFSQQQPSRMTPAQNTPRKNPTKSPAEDYMAKLTSEFAQLLKERVGTPFAFSMKPLSDTSFTNKEYETDLLQVKSVVEQILLDNNIDAIIKTNQYKTGSHHFVVYFVKPKEADAAKNKELIAALRQVVNNYVKTLRLSSINIFLVLANAQAVIEEHLGKIGAVKFES